MVNTSNPSKQLTYSTMAKRVAFCNANLSRNWSQVMFTDRCKFYHHYPGKSYHMSQALIEGSLHFQKSYGFVLVGVVVKSCEWVRVGSRRAAPKVNHASCYNVYAGITRYGVTSMCTVAGTTKHTSIYTNKKGQQSKNITSHEYYDVLTKHLLPEGRRLFSSVGVSRWLLQQDNDPSHKASSTRALQDWKEKAPGHVVELLPNWPPNSPDLSPIENVWGYVQREVNKAGCKTFPEFKTKVEQTFKNLSQRHLTRLFASMKDRINQCLALKGAKTRY
jgi:hypothetical protein